MRLTLLLSAILAVANAAAVLQTRQTGGLSGVLANAFMSRLRATRIDELKPLTQRPNAKRIFIRHGPFQLRATGSKEKTTNGMSLDPAGSGWQYLMDSDFPRDITILRTESNVVFEDGKRADVSRGVYNHHTVFYDMAKSDPSIIGCAGNKPAVPIVDMSIFMGGAGDKGPQYFSTPDGNFNSGYYIGKDDKIIMFGDVVNYRNTTETVYMDSEIEYVPGRLADGLEVSQQIIAVGQCDGKGAIIQPPKEQKKFTLKGSEMTITKDGFFVTGKGHLHDGGVNLIWTLNGKEICNTKAAYGGVESTMVGTQSGDGKEWATISEMSFCPGPVQVKKGDKMLLEAFYDLDQHPPRLQHGGGMAEEMALVGATFATKLGS